MMGVWLAWLTGLSPAAWAEDTTWYLGDIVAQVSLVAPSGGLPDENLEPLLRMEQGEPLDLELVRQDLTLLFRVGSFDAVEARVEPWLALDELGEPIEAVHLVYSVYAPPTVGKVKIDGVRGTARRVVEAAHQLDRGEAYHLEDELALRERLETALAEEGWTEAQVSIGSSSGDDGTRDLELDVVLGEPKRFRAVQAAGDLGVDEKTMQRWLKRAGIAEGKRVVTKSIRDARELVLEKLETKGYVEAHVNMVLAPEQDALSVLVDAGRELDIRWTARKGGPETRTEQLTGIRRLLLRATRPSKAEWAPLVGATDRLADVRALEAKAEIAEWYAVRGYVDARVDTTVKESPDRLSMAVYVRTGPRHTLERIHVKGADTFGERFIRGAVREAAPESLALGIATRDAAEEAMTAVRDFYRGQGFLEAQVELERLKTHRRSPMDRLLNHKPSSIYVKVVEGPRTALGELVTTGGSGTEIPVIEAKARALVGGPFQPNALERLSLELADAYRQEGYLYADATMHTEIEGAVARAHISIEPGELVRLRSVIVRGNQRTKRRAIVREVGLAIGDPVTPAAIAETRAALYDLDTFRVVSPDLSGDDERVKDLLINLEEKQNILVETGGGFSTDQGASLLARATHRNIGGLAHKLSATGKGGFGYLGDNWALDTAEPIWSAGVRYEAPYVPGRGERFIVDLLLNEAVQEATFRLTRFGLSTGVHVQVSERSEALVDYHVQLRTLEDVDPGALVNGDPWLPFVGLDAAQADAPRTPSDQRAVGGVGFSWITDLRDDRFNPTRGTYLSGLFDIGDGLVSDLATLKSQARIQQLLPVGPLTLDLVGLGGAGWAEGRGTTLAVEDRFYLGGAATVRGFHQDTVGPANYVLRPEVDFPDQIEPLIDGTALRSNPLHWVPTGGDAMAALSVELRTPMPLLGFKSLDGWSFLVFSDLGHVGFLDYTINTTSRLQDTDPLLRASVGTGIRVATPIGPASLDVGFNPWRLEGRNEPLVVPHLSIGAL